MRRLPLHAWIVVAFLLAQRLAIPIPGGQVAFNVALTLAVAFLLVFSKRMYLRPDASILLLAFTAIGGISAILSPVGANLLSLVQVLVLWLPWLMRPNAREQTKELTRDISLAVIYTVAAASAFSLLQIGVSSSAGFFLDPYGWLPEQFLLSGYNTTYNVGSIGTWDKGNGGIFLEPSFLSLFAGVSITMLVAHDEMRPLVRGALSLILLAGLVSSAALSGLVVIPAILLILLRHPRRGLFISAFIAAGAVVAASTPVIQGFLARLTSGGSNDARLVRPYTELLPIVLQDKLLLGFGPGAADEFASRLSGADWQGEVTAPTLVKLLFDYGLIGFVILLALVAVVAVQAQLPRIVVLALLIALLIPTNGLASPLLAPLVGLLLASGSSVPARGQGSRVVRSVATQDA